MANKTIFRWNLNILAEIILKTLQNKFDFFLVIEGNRGISKSTLAYHIATRVARLYKKQIKKALEGISPEELSDEDYETIRELKKRWRFNPNKDLLFKQQEVLDAINKRWHSIFIADELINVAFNRDFYTEGQKNIIKALNMNRDHSNFFCSCVPQFSTIDTQLKAMCKMRISVIKRGKAIIQTPHQTIYSKDGWDTSQNEKIEKDWLKKNLTKPKYTKLTTFRGTLSFPKLKPEVEEIYQQIKTSKRNKIMEEQDAPKENKVIVPTSHFIDIITRGGVTREEFDKTCRLMNENPERVVERINRQLRAEGKKERFTSLFKVGEKNLAIKIKKERAELNIPEEGFDEGDTDEDVKIVNEVFS